MDITTPSLLFSAICMLLSAYNNMYLSLSRSIREFISIQKQEGRRDKRKMKEINIFRKRIEYIKKMQFFAVISLLLATISIFFLLFSKIYIGRLSFILSLISFLISIYFAIRDILHITDGINSIKIRR